MSVPPNGLDATRRKARSAIASIAIVMSCAAAAVAGPAAARGPQGSRHATAHPLWTERLVALAALHLADTGALDPNRPLGAVLPGAPEPYRSVALARWIDGSAAVPRRVRLASWDRLSVEGAAIAALLDDRSVPARRPEPVHALVLAAVVERTAGATVTEVLTERVFARLGIPRRAFRSASGPVVRGHGAEERAAPVERSILSERVEANGRPMLELELDEVLAAALTRALRKPGSAVSAASSRALFKTFGAFEGEGGALAQER